MSREERYLSIEDNFLVVYQAWPFVFKLLQNYIVKAEGLWIIFFWVHY